MQRLSLLIGTTAACLLTATATTPALAQQWGLLYPDGSIRGRGGLLLEGPNPGRMLQEQLTLPINRRSIDLNSGTIYRGGLIESGPNPSLRLVICLQTGIC